MKFLKPFVWLAALLVTALAAAGETPLALSAQSAIIIDAESGKVLWEKDADTPRYPASTTKIMTAMLLLEHCKPDEEIVAPPDIELITEASLHLKPGERILAKDMLYAIMLRSANDGCVATAVHIAGSVPKFVEMMNQKARELGCMNTNFNNPNGLNDEKHTTTARDLAIMARAAMRIPEFAEAVRTFKYRIQRDLKISPDTTMRSHNKYLLRDATADGIKTGWTIPAGRCYVGSATRNGYRIITVVLKSEDWQKDHAAMLDWAFANHNREYAFRPGQLLGPLKVKGGSVNEIMVQPSANLVHMWRKDLPKTSQVRFEHSGEVPAPVTKGDKLGQVILTDEDGTVQSVDLLAAQDVEQTVTAKLVTSAGGNSSFFLIGGTLCLGAFYLRAKSRRRLSKYAKPRPRPQNTASQFRE